MAIDGGCLCGRVRYQCAAESGGGHCHCIDCRKTSGTGHGSHMIVAEDEFALEGTVTFYEKPADSGNLIRRAFCAECGSPIYSTNLGMPGLVFVRASSLDDPNLFKPQMVVYANRAAHWDVMDPALPRFDGMPKPDELPESMR